jgi:type I restriction enzyme M protein
MDLSEHRRAAFRVICAESDEEPIANVIDRVASHIGAGPHLDFNAVRWTIDADADKHGVKLTAKRWRLIETSLAERDEAAARVIKKVHKPGKSQSDPLHGHFEASVEGKACVVEYEPDSELRDTEQVPLLEEGGIEAFIRREVLPYAPDAWVAKDSTKTGYEISFNRYFYKPAPLRTLDQIRADILALEQETEGLLAEIVGAERA